MTVSELINQLQSYLVYKPDAGNTPVRLRITDVEVDKNGIIAGDQMCLEFLDEFFQKYKEEQFNDMRKRN